MLLRSMRSLLIPKRFFTLSRVLRGDYEADPDSREIICDREVVGNGMNSTLSYCDNAAFPFPAIRFRRPTPDILALREKEKGDWRQLTVEEKKTLYRASFCQTFAEFQAPTGEWKSVIGCGLMFFSLAIMLHLFLKYITRIEIPETFSEEYRKKTFKKMIDMEVGIIEGMSSKWDYENDRWKK